MRFFLQKVKNIVGKLVMKHQQKQWAKAVMAFIFILVHLFIIAQVAIHQKRQEVKRHAVTKKVCQTTLLCVRGKH